jgi:DNA-binding transcriptional ArsR family regulator
LEQLLWYLLAGTRGGPNRIRIIQALRERPYNANQLCQVVGLDYRTTCHHLKVLTQNNVLARPSGAAYGSMYFLSGLMQAHLATFDHIRASLVMPSGVNLAKDDTEAAGGGDHHG